MTVRIMLLILMACMVGGMALDFVATTPLTETLRTVFRILQPLCLLGWALAGYLNRRPYWTRESWTRFLLIALIPVAAIVCVLWVSAGVDQGASWAGAGRSWLRFTWAAVVLIGILVGGGGAGYLLHKLGTEDKTQFDWPWQRRTG